MANNNFPRGLTPIEPSHRVHAYPKAINNGMAIGDAVRLDANGEILVAGPDTAALGSVFGLTDPDGVPASKVLSADARPGWEVLIADDPDQIFVLQMDDTDIGADSIGKMASTIFTGASEINDLSETVIDGSSVGTGTQVKLLGKADTQGNEYGPYCDWLVVISNHQLRNVAITTAKKGKGKKAA
jgi:hypothetical protein